MEVVVRAQLEVGRVGAECHAWRLAYHHVAAAVDYVVVEADGAREVGEKIVGHTPVFVAQRRGIHHHRIGRPHAVHVVVCGCLPSGLMVENGFRYDAVGGYISAEHRHYAALRFLVEVVVAQRYAVSERWYKVRIPDYYA